MRGCRACDELLLVEAGVGLAWKLSSKDSALGTGLQPQTWAGPATGLAERMQWNGAGPALHLMLRKPAASTSALCSQVGETRG